MAQPDPYNRATSFTQEQARSPLTPPPGRALDAEYAAIKRVLDQILANLALIQRDDTQIANATIGYDQLKLEVQLGFNAPKVWVPDRQFGVRDSTFKEGALWIVDVAHTASNSFGDDVANGYWRKLVDFLALLESLDYVDSVFGRPGRAIVAEYGDYNTTQISRGQISLETVLQDLETRLTAEEQEVTPAPNYPVTSVFGRTTAVVAESGDYTADQIPRPSTEETVEAAIVRLGNAATPADPQTSLTVFRPGDENGGEAIETAFDRLETQVSSLVNAQPPLRTDQIDVFDDGIYPTGTLFAIWQVPFQCVLSNAAFLVGNVGSNLSSADIDFVLSTFDGDVIATIRQLDNAVSVVMDPTPPVITAGMRLKVVVTSTEVNPIPTGWIHMTFKFVENNG